VTGADDVLILLVWLDEGEEDGDGGLDREEATQP
jgi:hypothetical protein